MTPYVFRLPDLGEGTVEAELIAWHVKPGDLVKEDQLIAEVMTEKAAVELPSPVGGRVVDIAGKAGDILRVGSNLITFEIVTANVVAEPASAPSPKTVASPPQAAPAVVSQDTQTPPAVTSPVSRIMASPATRRRAHEAGIDLSQVRGSGPGGRITPEDLESSAGLAPVVSAREGTEEVKVVGLRRVIAQRMSESKRTIPHFGYVEEIDITELESLRVHLNERATPPISYLPFIIAALVRALRRFPQCNARFDAERNVVVRHRAVHVGIATQTPEGLLVPVLRHAESLSIEQMAREIRTLAERARTRKSPREELTGSTITVSSLGKLGGISSTPVINAPEVAIIGVNKSAERVVVVNGAITVRRIMNLSSAFDHRFVDGHDAASLIQEIRQQLEHPATIFMH